MSDLIDAYLDQLLGRLRGSARDVRRVLAEAEDHLREAEAAGVAAGLSEPAAQQQAINQFGSPRLVARHFRAVGAIAPLPRREVLTGAALALAGVAAVGLIAIGVSGLVADGLGALFGPGFVAGDLPGVTYTPERCAELLEYVKGPATCAQAATAHHFGEIVEYRVAAGILGLVMLGGYWLFRRSRHTTLLALPEGFSAIVGTALFGAAAAVLLLDSLNAGVIAATEPGPVVGIGAALSAGLVAILVAVGYGRSLYRTMLVR